MNSKEDRINAVEEAQELLNQAIDKLEWATEGDMHAKSYLIDQLKVLTSQDSGFLGSDFNCDKLIESIKEEEDQ